MVMMMFMSCYTIVDGIFISRYLGSEALSAANIVYPVFNLLLAVGIMFATGGSAVVSKKLGEGKKEEAMAQGFLKKREEILCSHVMESCFFLMWRNL